MLMTYLSIGFRLGGRTTSTLSKEPPAGELGTKLSFSERYLSSYMSKGRLKGNRVVNLQVGLSDIAAGNTTILSIDRINLDKAVSHSADFGNGVYKVCKSKVAVDCAVVGGSRVILDFLHKHDVRCLKIR